MQLRLSRRMDANLRYTTASRTQSVAPDLKTAPDWKRVPTLLHLDNLIRQCRDMGLPCPRTRNTAWTITLSEPRTWQAMSLHWRIRLSRCKSVGLGSRCARNCPPARTRAAPTKCVDRSARRIRSRSYADSLLSSLSPRCAASPTPAARPELSLPRFSSSPARLWRCANWRCCGGHRISGRL